jgi:hypothetical protein
MSKTAGTSLVRRVVVVAVASAALLVAPSAAKAAPTSVTPPTISGTLELGQALTASTGTWTDASSPIVRYEYQWARCRPSEEGYECIFIDFANANPYTLPWSLAGSQAEVTVHATDEQGDVGVASSEVTDVVTYNGPHFTWGESTVGAGSVTGFVTGPAASRTADANLSCPSACGALYRYVPGTAIELIATPAPGAAFLGWGGACSSSAPTCSVTLGGDAAVVATFSGSGPASPVLPFGYENEAGEAQPPASGAPSRGAWEASSGSASSATGLPAHLLGIHYRRRHVQAVVKCQQARPCRLSLAILAGTRMKAMIAQRSFTVAPRRRARISLALNRAGERIIARRHRLLVTTRLTLRGAGRASLIEQSRFTLTG